MAANPLIAGNSNWVTHGPFGGMWDASFTFHPAMGNVIFVSNQGGVFRSADGGLNWTRTAVEDFGLKTRISLSNSNLVYIVSGPPYRGSIVAVYRSFDAGLTWQFFSVNYLHNASIQAYLMDFEVDPKNAQVLYISYFQSGVFKSIDGGLTWSASGNGLPSSREDSVFDLEVDPRGNGIAYALTTTGHIFKSSDSASTWQSVSNGVTLQIGGSVAIDPTNPNVVYVGGRSGFFKSTNGGASWNPINCACAPYSISIDPRNSRNILVLSARSIPTEEPRLLRTGDGSVTWATIPTPSRSVIFSKVSIHPTTGISYLSDGDGILLSKDLGLTWQRTNAGLNNQRVVAISASPLRPGRLITTDRDSLNQTYQSSDGGKSWKNLLPGLNLRGFVIDNVAVHPRNPNLLVIASRDYGIGVSSDSGKTWRFTHHFSASGEANICFDATDENIIHVPAGKTTDQGKTWKSVPLKIRDPDVLAVSPSGKTLLLITGRGDWFRSLDRGNTWTELHTLNRGSVSHLEFDPLNENTAYFSGYGVFKSTDSGSTWRKKSNGLGDRIVLTVRVDPSISKTLYASVYIPYKGCVIYVSHDGAEHWKRFTQSPLGRTYIYDILIQPLQKRIYAATDRGVYMRSLP